MSSNDQRYRSASFKLIGLPTMGAVAPAVFAQHTSEAHLMGIDVSQTCLTLGSTPNAQLQSNDQTDTSTAATGDIFGSDPEALGTIAWDCVYPAVSTGGGLLLLLALFNSEQPTSVLATFEPQAGTQSYAFGYRHVSDGAIGGNVGDPNYTEDFLPVAAYVGQDGSLEIIRYPTWQDLFAAENGTSIHNLPSGSVQGDITSVYSTSAQSNTFVSVTGANAPATPITSGDVTLRNDTIVGEAINDNGGSLRLDFSSGLFINYTPDGRVLEFIDSSNWDTTGGHYPDASDDFGVIDLDGDGQVEFWFFDYSTQDFVVYQRNSNTLQLEYLSDLSASLNAIEIDALSNLGTNDTAQEIHIADIDLDGDWDLIVGTQNQVQAFEFL